MTCVYTVAVRKGGYGKTSQTRSNKTNQNLEKRVPALRRISFLGFNF